MRKTIILLTIIFISLHLVADDKGKVYTNYSIGAYSGSYDYEFGRDSILKPVGTRNLKIDGFTFGLEQKKGNWGFKTNFSFGSIENIFKEYFVPDGVRTPIIPANINGKFFNWGIGATYYHILEFEYKGRVSFDATLNASVYLDSNYINIYENRTLLFYNEDFSYDENRTRTHILKLVEHTPEVSFGLGLKLSIEDKFKLIIERKFDSLSSTTFSLKLNF